jgi:hypothetical protein
MKEVDYLMHSLDKSKTRFRFPSPVERAITPQAPLFDLCYLVDNRHQRGALNGSEEIYDQIADQLFLEIGTPFGARSDSVRVNLNTVSGLELDRVYRTGRRYSGFGNHTISLNREKIVELASLKSTCITSRDILLGEGLPEGEAEKAAGELMSRHRLEESNARGLVEALITGSEAGRELVTAAYSQDRPDHSRFSAELWARLDSFWLRRAAELRAQAENRARAMLDGAEQQAGILADIDESVDASARRKGVASALDLADAMLSRIRALEELTEAEHQHHHAEARRLMQEAENASGSLTTMGQQLAHLLDMSKPAGRLSQAWRLLGIIITLGMWHPGYAAEEDRARQARDLNHRAQEQRNRFLSIYNRAVEHRLAEEARAVALHLFSEIISRLSDIKKRLESIKQGLEDDSRNGFEALERLIAEVKCRPFDGGNTMRRDITADYFDQYHSARCEEAIEEVVGWLLPESQPAMAALASYDREKVRRKFYDRYAQELLRRQDRRSLAEMMDGFRANGRGGSLTDRIGEGLRFCLPFWDIRVPGNQFTTEVLLVGLEQEHAGVQDYLTAHAAAQRGQVYPQVVPTGQDSAILISRVAHGASYYWHAQDESYFREYLHVTATCPYPVHLDARWRRLPEPIPDPGKYERRVFALGIAYELIAVRGATYYFDPTRRYSQVGTSRQATADWMTVPLIESDRATEQASAPVAPDAEDKISDDRATAMHSFIDADRRVAIVREKLAELFNERGREAVRRQLQRYCQGVLAQAVKELGEDTPVRRQLEAELAELEEVVVELKPAAGTLKLAR